MIKNPQIDFDFSFWFSKYFEKNPQNSCSFFTFKPVTLLVIAIQKCFIKIIDREFKVY